MNLGRFPRVSLGHFPTALEPMTNLTKFLGGPNIYIKRDDCTGLASGGNKTRKLEFLVAEAMALGADTLITQGATQSNHVRQTIAAAARVGMKSKALLENRVTNLNDDYTESGNVLLDRILGGDIVGHLPAGTDMQAAMETLAEELRSQGMKPYVIPGGGSNPVGALGYVTCAMEMLQQAYDMNMTIDCVVHATGSAGTQAGLVAGFEGAQSGVPVFGVSVRADKKKQEENVFRLTQATADYIGLKMPIARESIVADDGYVGSGYGQPTPSMIEAVRLCAQLDGILLDPVYTGKGMAGLIGNIRNGKFTRGQNVIFVHTGGSAALFGYRNTFA
jgi:L-cysteate sulfo-lyase